MVGSRTSLRLGREASYRVTQRPTCRGGSDIAAACASLDAAVGAGDRRCRFDARCVCCGPDEGRPSCEKQGSGFDMQLHSRQRLRRQGCAGRRQVAFGERSEQEWLLQGLGCTRIAAQYLLHAKDATLEFLLLPATASGSPAATASRRPRRSPPPLKQPTASTAVACWRPSLAAPSEPRHHRHHFRGSEAPPRLPTPCWRCCRGATGRVCGCRRQAWLLP